MKIKNIVSALALSLLVGQNIEAKTLIFKNKTNNKIRISIGERACNDEFIDAIAPGKEGKKEIQTKIGISCLVKDIAVHTVGNDFQNGYLDLSGKLTEGTYEITLLPKNEIKTTYPKVDGKEVKTAKPSQTIYKITKVDAKKSTDTKKDAKTESAAKIKHDNDIKNFENSLNKALKKATDAKNALNIAEKKLTTYAACKTNIMKPICEKQAQNAANNVVTAQEEVAKMLEKDPVFLKANAEYKKAVKLHDGALTSMAKAAPNTEAHKKASEYVNSTWSAMENKYNEVIYIQEKQKTKVGTYLKK